MLVVKICDVQLNKNCVKLTSCHYTYLWISISIWWIHLSTLAVVRWLKSYVSCRPVITECSKQTMSWRRLWGRTNSPLLMWTWDWHVRKQRSPPSCLLQFKVGLEGGFAGGKPWASRWKSEQNKVKPKKKTAFLHSARQKRVNKSPDSIKDASYEHKKSKWQESKENRESQKYLLFLSPMGLIYMGCCTRQQHWADLPLINQDSLPIQSFLFQWSL